MRYLLFTLLLGAIFVGCNSAKESDAIQNGSGTKATHSQTDKSTLNTVNKFCPIMGGDVVADGGKVEWNGQMIGFCCPECEPKWTALSDEDKASKLAEANKKTEADHDHDHDAHKSDDHKDHKGMKKKS